MPLEPGTQPWLDQLVEEPHGDTNDGRRIEATASGTAERVYSL